MDATDANPAGPRTEPAAPDGHNPPRVRLPILLCGLILAYAGNLLPGLFRLIGLDLRLGPAGVLLWNWLAVGLLLVYVWRVEGLGPGSLRLVRPAGRDLNWAGWLGGAALLWHWLMAAFVVPPAGTSMESGTGTLVALGPLAALAVVVTVSVTEEILWRGYVVERLGAWIGLLPAAILGFAVFAAGHLPFFGPWWLLTVGPGAALLYVLLLWRRNLWACMLAHLIGNIPIVFVALGHG